MKKDFNELLKNAYVFDKYRDLGKKLNKFSSIELYKNDDLDDDIERKNINDVKQ